MSDPIISLYVDNLVTWYPPQTVLQSVTNTLGKTTHLILAFWEPSGPLDVAQAWVNGTFPSDAIDTFHQLGVKVMVSAGGANSEPISADPSGGAAYGQALAAFAIANHLDGVDFDIEDPMYQSDPSTAIAWTVAATKAVRDGFPSAIISHAPQAPYFSPAFAGAPYLAVDQQVGSLIDFYNIQFYNQLSTSYDTYQSLFTQSNGWATKSSVSEINQAGVPMSRIVVGKPVIAGDAANTGYVPIAELASLFQQAVQDGIVPAGAMGWQDHSDATTETWTTDLFDALSGNPLRSQRPAARRSLASHSPTARVAMAMQRAARAKQR